MLSMWCAGRSGRMPLRTGRIGLVKGTNSTSRKGISKMQLSHTPRAVSAVFDDPNLVSCAGLVPVMSLAGAAGLDELADQHLSVRTDRGSNAGLKVTSLVAGMVAGADSIDDMGLLRHGGMDRVFDNAYAPSTLGSFLRSFTFGHVRQLDAVAARFLVGLGEATPLVAGAEDQIVLDIDDSVFEVYGHAKQGAGIGYSGVHGLNALLATVATQQAAPVIVAQRLRKGSAASMRGAGQLVTDALSVVRKLDSTHPGGTVLLRGDSAFYARAVINTAIRAGAQVSITVPLDPKVKAAIAAISEDTWQPIEYTDAVFDHTTGRWISRAQVAEIPFTAFSSKPPSEQVAGRLVVRRIPDLNPQGGEDGQGRLFDIWRFHPFFTTSTLPTVSADKTHRGHAIIEQVHADLKNSALAHLPSGKFCANAAWLVLAVMAFNLTRAAATLAGHPLTNATTGTIRRTLITVPARTATSARRLTLHLPSRWPWQTAWTTLFTHLCRPPPAATT